MKRFVKRRLARVWPLCAAFVCWLCLGLGGVPALAQQRWIASPPGGPMALADAVRQAADGDTIELVPGEYAGAGLVLEGRRLTLKGVGPGVVFKAEPKPVAAKALLHVKGGEVTLINIKFMGMRSDSGEGAGVLFTGGGTLAVRDCIFHDNEAGLRTDNHESAVLLIERTQFGMAPKVPGGLHHLLDVGRIARLQVEGSRFQQGFEGHLLRSRAKLSLVRWNIIVDSPWGGASYELEFPAGGVATVVGNVLGQGRQSQNRVVLSYGSGDRHWADNRLVLAHNTFVNFSWMPAWFLRVHDGRMPPGVKVTAINNLLVGPGLFGLGVDGRFEGNRFATLGMLNDIDTYAFELPPSSTWRNSGVDPRSIDGQDLSPTAEFSWPVGTVPLAPGRTRWAPGAFQK